MNFSKSVYVVISVHGSTQLDPFLTEPEIRTFTVPAGINVIDIMASPPGAINMVCHNSLKGLSNVISNAIETLDEDTKENLDNIEVLVPIVSDIKNKLKAHDLGLLNAYNTPSQGDTDIAQAQELQHTWDNRFNMGFYQAGDELLNKQYTYDKTDTHTHWLDNKIQVFNIPEQDEDFDVLEHFLVDSISERYFIINKGNIINFLQENGVENVVFFDLSCSNFEDHEKLSVRTARGVRREYHKETQKYRPHPYMRRQTNKLGGRRRRGSKLRGSKLRGSKLRGSKLRGSKLRRQTRKYKKTNNTRRTSKL
jgi:hypothetical protein